MLPRATFAIGRGDTTAFPPDAIAGPACVTVASIAIVTRNKDLLVVVPPICNPQIHRASAFFRNRCQACALSCLRGSPTRVPIGGQPGDVARAVPIRVCKEPVEAFAASHSRPVPWASTPAAGATGRERGVLPHGRSDGGHHVPGQTPGHRLPV